MIEGVEIQCLPVRARGLNRNWRLHCTYELKSLRKKSMNRKKLFVSLSLLATTLMGVSCVSVTDRNNTDPQLQLPDPPLTAKSRMFSVTPVTNLRWC